MNDKTSKVLEGVSTQAPASRSLPSSTTVFSGDVLIVEYNFLIAMDVEELVSELGADPVHVASSCDDELDLIGGVPLHGAYPRLIVQVGPLCRFSVCLAP